MKLLFIAGREPSYARVNIILKGLKKNKINIRECLSSSRFSLIRYFSVIFKFILMKKKDCDAVFVGFFGQPIVPILRLFTRKKIIFDAFLSSYDTMIFDKKKVKNGSLAAKLFFYLDKLSCRFADIVIVDTNQHIDYFVSTFGVQRKKMERVFIGADDDLFNPARYKSKRKSKDFIVEFHGNFIPLQGVDYIIGAAKKLEKQKDIKFVIIGHGQTFNKCIRLARNYRLYNIDFLGKKKPTDIPKYVNMCDIGLGIFGDTEKARRVIPNKAYEIIAMKKPLLTADTPAAAELFKHKKHAFLCKVADSDSLARSILILKKNKALRGKIAQNGYNLFKERCTPVVLGKAIKTIVMNLV